LRDQWIVVQTSEFFFLQLVLGRSKKLKDFEPWEVISYYTCSSFDEQICSDSLVKDSKQ